MSHFLLIKMMKVILVTHTKYYTTHKIRNRNVSFFLALIISLWYIVLFFIPFANIYAVFKIYIELAHKFWKSTGFGVATVFFSIVCLPILAFSKTAEYK